jgi:hypothetical protein
VENHFAAVGNRFASVENCSASVQNRFAVVENHSAEVKNFFSLKFTVFSSQSSTNQSFIQCSFQFAKILSPINNP